MNRPLHWSELLMLLLGCIGHGGRWCMGLVAEAPMLFGENPDRGQAVNRVKCAQLCAAHGKRPYECDRLSGAGSAWLSAGLDSR